MSTKKITFAANSDNFIKVDGSNYVYDEFIECCGNKIYRINNKHFGVCPICGTRRLFIYEKMLQPIQRKALNFRGGTCLQIQSTGTGKTMVNCYKIFKDCLQIPGWVVGIIANTDAQLEDTVKNEMAKFFIMPKDKLGYESDFKKANRDRWIMDNGSQIQWLSNNNNFVLKGRTLSAAIISEVESLPKEMFNEIHSRVRHPNSKVYALDKNGRRKLKLNDNGMEEPIVLKNIGYIMVEGNTSYVPWIEQLICKSHKIYYTNNVKINAYSLEGNKDTSLITLLATPLDFPYIDEAYIKGITKNKSEEEIERDLYCNIYADDGMVFANINRAIQPVFALENKFERHYWRLIFASDLGTAGATTLMVLAINAFEPNKVYAIDEYYATDRSILEHIPFMKEMIKKYRRFVVKAHTCDKLGKSRELANNKGAIDVYRENGIKMTAPKTKSVKQEIMQIRTLMQNNNFVIFNNIVYGIMEARYLKFITDPTTGLKKFPKDNNIRMGTRTRHAIDSWGLGIAEINFDKWSDNFKLNIYYDTSFYGTRAFYKGKEISVEEIKNYEKLFPKN